jgi:hypothetical protein
MAREFGNAPHILPRDPSVQAEAEFVDWYPMPCSCYECCAITMQQQRTYARVYESKYEINTAIAPMGMCTVNENCIVDWLTISYFDRQPTRSAMCCFCIPLNCCGNPKIYSKTPYCCCCIDISAWYGKTISYAPCACCELRICLCCGKPCYEYCGLPFLGGMLNPEKFLQSWANAMKAYEAKHPDLQGQLATFSANKEVLMGTSEQITGRS